MGMTKSKDLLRKGSQFLSTGSKCSSNWWKDVVFASGMYPDLKGSDEYRVLRLERFDVAEWKKEDVLEWLKQIKKLKRCGAVFMEKEIDGSILCELDEQVLLNINIPLVETPSLLKEIDRLKRTRKFPRPWHTVKSKLEKFPAFFASEFEEMIDALSDSSMMKQKFLCVCPGQCSEITKTKIVITEILDNNLAKNVRKIISPLIFSLPMPRLQNEFGFFHTAIIVGPWYLEWNDSELVVPKKFQSGRAIISADVGGGMLRPKKESLEGIADKIADVIVKWNTRFRYKRTSQKHAIGKQLNDEGFYYRYGNCQDFVDDVMNTLGINLNFTGTLGSFVKSLRESGKCELEFNPSMEFRDHFGLKETTAWIFKTHRALDEFCIKIRGICFDVSHKFHSEWSLLKSFDRAFWLRHLKMPENSRYIPFPPKDSWSTHPYNTGCPFFDPRETKSYFRH